MKLSVIIPALNEVLILPRTLAAVRRTCPGAQIIVADGGSRDGTQALCRSAGVTMVQARQGRASQMNAGAAAARGEMLLFLHADTILPPAAQDMINDALGKPGTIAGSFYLRFDHNHLVLRFYSAMSRLNWPWFTFGDQGLFLHRETFHGIGGFAEMPLMEDLEIQTRLRAAGRFEKLDQAVVTSSRRFRRVGVVTQQVRNICLVLAYHFGVSPHRLARYYEQHCSKNVQRA